jgi:hypothetical protein
MIELIKYPRTPHLEGSRLQAGDEDLQQVPLAALRDAHVVIEEKVDGANAAFRFDDDGRLHLQSRGHFLSGGDRERHFDLFKRWAAAHQARLHAALGSRFVVFGEWVYGKHTIFYDRLPHYFLEYDVLDTTGAREWLSTPARRRLLAELPIASVPVLYEGRTPRDVAALRALVGPSHYKSPGWRDALAVSAAAAGVDVDRAVRETDPEDTMEGLYIKAETDDEVVGRYKWIRASYLQAVVDSGSHWHARPIVPNALAPGTDIFSLTSPPR